MNQHPHPKANAEVMPHDRPFISEIPKFRKLAASNGLVGLVNNTKWDELITVMRGMQDIGWSPDYRYTCIDSDFISGWDGEWWHHLPFPMISVRWLDLNCIERNVTARLLPDKVIDHSSRIHGILQDIGLDYEIGKEFTRIHGYAPRDCTGLLK